MPTRIYEFTPEEIKELLAKALGFEEKNLRIEFQVEEKFGYRGEPLCTSLKKVTITEKNKGQ